MKVLFVSDFTLEQREGGAQVSNSFLIAKGRDLGHEIIEHDHTSSVIDFLSSYDLLVSSNLEVISSRTPEKLKFILNHPKHIRLEHDSCSYLNNSDREKLFTSSQKNFFLSNFHISFFRQNYGDYFKNVEIVYDPINVEIFNTTNCEKKYDIVYCGYLHPLKGLDRLIQFARENPERYINIFGWGEGDFDSIFGGVENITFNGSKTHEEIATILQQSKALYHNPVVNEPFCRMVGEGLLCGIKEIIGATEKIGACLELERVGMESFQKGCHEAPDQFWGKVDV